MFEPAKGFGVDDSIDVPLKRGSDRAFFLLSEAAFAGAGFYSEI